MRIQHKIEITLEEYNGNSHLSIKQDGKYIADTVYNSYTTYKQIEQLVLDNALMLIDNHKHGNAETIGQKVSSKAE